MAELTERDLYSYIFGTLENQATIATIQQREREDPEFAAELELTRLMSGATVSLTQDAIDVAHQPPDVQPAQPIKPSAKASKRIAPVFAIAAALLFAVSLGLLASRNAKARSLVEANQARSQLQGEVTDLKATLQSNDGEVKSLRQSVAGLKEDNEVLNLALDYLSKPAKGQNEDVFVSMIRPEQLVAAQAAPPKPGSVDVVLDNVLLESKLTWQVEKQNANTILIPSGANKGKFPAGKPVTLTIEPRYTRHWVQPVRVTIVRGEKQMGGGSALGKIVFPFEDGDKLYLWFEPPVAPWNSILCRVKKEQALLTLQVPQARFRIERFTSADQEDLPNAALFWAREGTEGMARELAKHFVSQRHKQTAGNFRGAYHTSLTVPFANGKVQGIFATISEDDLAAELETAFELLLRQRIPHGPTLASELETAKKLLKEKKL